METFESQAKGTKEPELCVEICSGETSLPSTQQEYIKQYLRELLGDLRIHMSLKVVFKSSENLRANHILFDITVNEAKGRIPFKSWLKGTETNTLTSRLCEALFLNRILLITEEYTEYLHRKWFLNKTNLKSGKKISKEQLYRLLKRCTQLGLNMDVAKRVAEQWASYTKNIEGENAENIERDGYTIEVLLAAEMPRHITINLSSQLYEKVFSSPSLDDTVLLMRESLFYELGVQFPTVEFRLSTDLPNPCFRVWLHQIRGPLREGLTSDESFVNATREQLNPLKIKGREAINPVDGSKSTIISATDAEKLKESRFTRWNAEEYLVLTLAAELRLHSPEYLSISQVETILSDLNQSYPVLVLKALEQFSLCTISEVLQNLLREKVPIRNMWTILETLIEVKSKVPSVAKESFDKKFPIPLLHARISPAVGTDIKLSAKHFSEACRISLGSRITVTATRGRKTISAWLLSKEFENHIQSSSQYPMAERERAALLTAIDKQVSSFFRSNATTLPAILTTMSVRPLLRDIIEIEFPYIKVLSYNELDSEINIKPISCIE